VRHLITTALNRAGFQVVEASDGSARAADGPTGRAELIDDLFSRSSRKRQFDGSVLVAVKATILHRKALGVAAACTRIARISSLPSSHTSLSSAPINPCLLAMYHLHFEGILKTRSGIFSSFFALYFRSGLTPLPDDPGTLPVWPQRRQKAGSSS
jgi:hypothetical protein